MKPLLSVENISVPGRISDASLQIFPGEFVGLIGTERRGQDHAFACGYGDGPGERNKLASGP